MLLPYVYAMGAILCWASLPAATGSGLRGLSIEELLFYSFASAALYLYFQDVVLTRRWKIHFPRPRACVFGIWGIFLYHYVYYQAMARAPLAEGAILATTWSLWIVVFSSLLVLRRLPVSIAVAALMGLGGAGMVIAAGRQLSFDSRHMQGYLLALCCGLIWSSFSVGLPRLKLRREPMTAFTILAAFCAGLLYLATMPHRPPSPAAFWSAVYLGCVPLGLSFFLWNRAVTRGNLVIIGFLSYLTPPLAVLLVALIHGEKVSAQVLAGMVVIIVASVVGRYFLGRCQRQGAEVGKNSGSAP